VIEALEEYRVDLAASSQRVEDARLTRRVLGYDPLVLAVHRSHPLASRDRIAPSALAGHCLLMRENGSTTRTLTAELLRDAGVQPGPLLEIGSRESIREAVLRNIGVSIIARHEVPENPLLKVVELEGAPLIAEYLYCLKERRQARLPAAFLGLAREAAR
jgi:DNA-binding transcriptional LysR family regulator